MCLKAAATGGTGFQNQPLASISHRPPCGCQGKPPTSQAVPVEDMATLACVAEDPWPPSWLEEGHGVGVSGIRLCNSFLQDGNIVSFGEAPYTRR